MTFDFETFAFFLTRDATLTERGYATVSLSVRPAVRLSVCDVEVWFSHGLEYFENNFTAEYLKASTRADPTRAIWCNGDTPKIKAE